MNTIKTLLILPLSLASILGVSVAASEKIPELDCVIEPSEIVDIGSATAGVLDKIAFDRGDMVEKNQVIARLESGTESATAELARVRASLDTGVVMRQASAEFFARNQERSSTLGNQQAISKQDLDQLRTEARVADLQVRQERDIKRLAELEYRRAKQALSRRTIRSPIEGVVVERFKSVGEYVEDTPVMRIAQLDPLYVETILPVELLGRIKVGMHAKVETSVPGQSAKTAEVTRIDRVADAASGTFGVRLSLDNPRGDIATGVRCTLDFDNARYAASAPASAVKEHHNKSEQSRPESSIEPQQSDLVATPTDSLDAISASVALENQDYQSSSSRQIYSGTSQCYQVGPISNRKSASNLMSQLQEGGVDVELREGPSGVPAQYFVLSRKVPTSQEASALVHQLETANINDTALLRRGPYVHHLSLGLFAKQELAERQAAEIVSKGFEARVVPRLRVNYWLTVTDHDLSANTDLENSLSELDANKVEVSQCPHLVAGRS